MVCVQGQRQCSFFQHAENPDILSRLLVLAMMSISVRIPHCIASQNQIAVEYTTLILQCIVYSTHLLAG